MVIRIVRMQFKPGDVTAFLETFEANRKAIGSFSGCTSLKLMKDVNLPNTFVTISHWNSTADLENYRQSELFSDVWGKVKTLFSAKPEAFTVETFG